VYAVDRPDRALWERVGAVARGGAGRLVAPAPHGSDLPEAGLDLLRDLPQARAWLTQAPGTVVLGNYVYADGGAFLRLAAAVDAVTAAVLDERPDAVTAMLATPTDVFAAPADAVAESQRRWARRGSRRVAQAPARALSAGRLFRPQYEATRPLGDRLHAGVADCLVPQQGPNYALAKALQRWRVTVTEAAGRTVSANVAPPARTRSVLRNRALAAAYAGAPRFGVEVFAPATASTLMAALLVHDLRAEQVPTSHPQETFMRGANPGGLWRIAYEPRSVLGLAVGLGLLRRRS
jgi:hypothetical protein